MIPFFRLPEKMGWPGSDTRCDRYFHLNVELPEVLDSGSNPLIGGEKPWIGGTPLQPADEKATLFLL